MMTDAHFATLLDLCTRNGVKLWRFDDAPAEFKALFGDPIGDEECLVYVPPDRLDADGDLDTNEPGLGWISDQPKHANLERCAGDKWGWYLWRRATDGGIVARTVDSEGAD